VHTVGAGGGSIAHVPELTGALRVGPQSAGAEPASRQRRRGARPPQPSILLSLLRRLQLVQSSSHFFWISMMVSICLSLRSKQATRRRSPPCQRDVRQLPLEI
jgi:N-methylhydantoinase A/oxoprolinase/acetone carboxylase beta subunit